MRTTNRAVRRHASGYQYLLKGHIYCEHCGHRMIARTAHVGGKVYAYYRCNAYKLELATECAYGSVHYPAAVVDRAVWNWLASLLTEPERLRVGLQTYQAEKEKYIAPLRERLRLVGEMLKAEQTKLDRLLDLYLSGDLPREMLAERRTQLEIQVRVVANEEKNLRAAIEAQTLSSEQIELVQSFSQEIASRLESAWGDAELMGQIIRIVDLQVRLSAHDGEKAAFVQCGIGQQALSLTDTPTNGCVHLRARRFSTRRSARVQPGAFGRQQWLEPSRTGS